SLIVACGRNRGIGKDNRLPWNLPDDLKRFKAITLGYPVIMGRKTLESIGRALPGRRNIVLSRNPDYVPPFSGVERAGSLEEALALADTDAFVIGGAEIYALALAKARRIYLTSVEAEPEADAYFPEWPKAEFTEVSREEHPRDERHAFAFSFIVLDRNRAG
ncbi:MAG: dihydrofolate reductase, partial [Oligoflexia bacterium]|nr:dihydrofolate reductase [Oligoflexia bacterium]